MFVVYHVLCNPRYSCVLGVQLWRGSRGRGIDSKGPVSSLSENLLKQATERSSSAGSVYSLRWGEKSQQTLELNQVLRIVRLMSD